MSIYVYFYLILFIIYYIIYTSYFNLLIFFFIIKQITIISTYYIFWFPLPLTLLLFLFQFCLYLFFYCIILFYINTLFLLSISSISSILPFYCCMVNFLVYITSKNCSMRNFLFKTFVSITTFYYLCSRRN